MWCMANASFLHNAMKYFLCILLSVIIKELSVFNHSWEYKGGTVQTNARPAPFYALMHEDRFCLGLPSIRGSQNLLKIEGFYVLWF